ncbi:NYN domain-containing protein [Candidatus Kaiserbacteria bacterium]|nr:NYN domain-containing protein [Candidatus Kaiserbacteria bacterium]
MRETERVEILIDAGNFYHLALKKLGVAEIDFDYEAFVSFLMNGRTLVPEGKRLYVGTVREKEGDLRTKNAMAEQRRFLSVLLSAKWQIKTSKLRSRIEEIAVDSRMQEYKTLTAAGVQTIHVERMREKGIDVKIATDLIVGAVDDKYDTAIVISSDTDLVPAIDWVRMRKKKRAEYVGFSIPDARGNAYASKPTFALIARTDVQRILVESDIRRFIKQKLMP